MHGAEHSSWASQRYFARLRHLCQGASPAGTADAHPVRLEGYGPGGAAVLVDCHSTDPAGTRRRVREAFALHGGQLGADGSVAYLFHPVATLLFPPGSDARALRGIALKAGAEDVLTHPDTSIEILADPDDFPAVQRHLAEAGHRPTLAERTWRPATVQPLSGPAASKLMHLMQALTRLQEIRAVYSNAELSAEDLEHGVGLAQE